MSKITIIAAHDKSGVIGIDGAIPWTVKSDMNHFKTATIGNVVIMGRSTWESLDGPLTGRVNIILTNNFTSVDIAKYKGNPNYSVLVVPSLQTALEHCKNSHKDKDVFIIGGRAVYEKAFEFATDMIISKLDIDVLSMVKESSSVVRFPEYDENDWVSSRTPITLKDRDSSITVTICNYHKKTVTDVEDIDITANICNNTFAPNKLLDMVYSLWEKLGRLVADTKQQNRVECRAMTDFMFSNIWPKSHLLDYDSIAYAICWNDKDGNIYQLPFLSNCEAFMRDYSEYINDNMEDSNSYVVEMACLSLDICGITHVITKTFAIYNYVDILDYNKLKRMAKMYDPESFKDLGILEDYNSNIEQIKMIRHMLSNKGD